MGVRLGRRASFTHPTRIHARAGGVLCRARLFATAATRRSRPRFACSALFAAICDEASSPRAQGRRGPPRETTASPQPPPVLPPPRGPPAARRRAGLRCCGEALALALKVELELELTCARDDAGDGAGDGNGVVAHPRGAARARWRLAGCAYQKTQRWRHRAARCLACAPRRHRAPAAPCAGGERRGRAGGGGKASSRRRGGACSAPRLAGRARAPASIAWRGGGGCVQQPGAWGRRGADAAGGGSNGGDGNGLAVDVEQSVDYARSPWRRAMRCVAKLTAVGRGRRRGASLALAAVGVTGHAATRRPPRPTLRLWTRSRPVVAVACSRTACADAMHVPRALRATRSSQTLSAWSRRVPARPSCSRSIGMVFAASSLRHQWTRL